MESQPWMKKTKIIIAGGGFAGLYAAIQFDKRLARRADAEVTLISRENFIVFTPMRAPRLCSPVQIMISHNESS